ncbi:MAG: caspase family protein, partial [Myxococcota bacterium]
MMHALTLAAWLASMAAGPALPAIAATSTTGTNTTDTAGSTTVENAPGTAGSTAVANTTERAAGAKRPRVYVLAIGNNASPIDEPSLAPLQYADDDAVRFYERFEGFAATRYLLTVFDPQTERRLAQISAPSGARVSPPTVRNLSNAIDALQHKLQADRTQNIESVVYIYYSGHGSTGQDGEPYLALIDGTITQDQLFNGMIDRLDADRIHVLIDACNAGAVVGLRGPFDEATEARRSPQPLVQLAGRAKLDRRPHVGIIVAATAGQAAHEWSRLESGIFTHQVLSALAGGGDVNADGRVEYSELHAFVGAANSGLPPHAQARV